MMYVLLYQKKRPGVLLHINQVCQLNYISELKVSARCLGKTAKETQTALSD